MFAFIAKHRGIWPISWMCEAPGVSRSGFHAWRTPPPGARAGSDAVLAERVRASFPLSDRTCGARRVRRDILQEGFVCGLHRIGRLTRLHGLRVRPRRRRLPKDTGKRSIIAPNMLGQDFEADRPNRKRVADFTCIRTAEGWLCLAVVPDLFGWRVAGWSMKNTMTADPVTDALVMAIRRRGKPDELPHHSDQGSQGGFKRSSQRLIDIS